MQGEAYATWVEKLLKVHLWWLDNQARGDRLVVPILATTQQDFSNLTGSSLSMARVAKLPFGTPHVQPIGLQQSSHAYRQSAPKAAPAKMLYEHAVPVLSRMMP